MPYYYQLPVYGATSNATPGSENTHARMLTISQQTPCMISAIQATGRNTALGGAGIRVRKYSANSTNGVATTPSLKNWRNPAANTTCFVPNTTWLIVPGSTPTDFFEMPISQVGGGGWIPNEQDDAIMLAPNGGSNGNIDYISVAATASMVIDLSVGFGEL